MWAIMALGLNIVVGYAGLLDLGYVAFWALGGYTAGWLMAFSFNWTCDFHLLSPVTDDAAGHPHQLLAGAASSPAALCAVLGIIIGAPTLRLRGDYLALVTLGFGEIIPRSSATPTTSTGSTSPTATRASRRSTRSAPGPALGAAGRSPGACSLDSAAGYCR